MRKFLDAALRSEIAAGNHHRTGGSNDAVEVLHRRSGFDLGDHERATRDGFEADPAHVVG